MCVCMCAFIYFQHNCGTNSMAYGPGGSMPYSHGSPIIPILSQINPVKRNYTYLLKAHSNIVLPSTSRPP